MTHCGRGAPRCCLTVRRLWQFVVTSSGISRSTGHTIHFLWRAEESATAARAKDAFDGELIRVGDGKRSFPVADSSKELLGARLTFAQRTKLVPGAGPQDPVKLSLVPDVASGSWRWVDRGTAALTDGARAPSSPAPAPLMLAHAPGPAPSAPPNICGALMAAGETSAPGQFLGCQEFRYYSGVETPPFGCHCSAWSVSCPFETCRAEQAWEEPCLAREATTLGFTALSKTWYSLQSNELTNGRSAFKDHPAIISLCMYWLPKPPNPSLPEINVPPFLPAYANLEMRGAPLADCVRVSDTASAIAQTKTALQAALAQPGLKVATIDCGGRNFHALIVGSPDAVKAAAVKAAQPGFCFEVAQVNARFCAFAPPGPAPAPQLWAAGRWSPAPAPARAPAPAARLPSLPVATAVRR